MFVNPKTGPVSSVVSIGSHDLTLCWLGLLYLINEICTLNVGEGLFKITFNLIPSQ